MDVLRIQDLFLYMLLDMKKRSGGVKVNSPFCELYVRVDDPAAVKVTLGSGGTKVYLI